MHLTVSKFTSPVMIALDQDAIINLKLGQVQNDEQFFLETAICLVIIS